MTITEIAQAETPPIMVFEPGEKAWADISIECDAGPWVQVLVECVGYRKTFWLPRSAIVKVAP